MRKRKKSSCVGNAEENTGKVRSVDTESAGMTKTVPSDSDGTSLDHGKSKRGRIQIDGEMASQKVSSQKHEFGTRKKTFTTR